MLSHLGIPEDRIVSPGKLARVETLIVPDVALRTHRWVSPLQAWTWSQISSNARGSGRSSKIFLSRRRAGDRPLHDIDEIESRFAAMGYEIVCPESLPIDQQIALARGAESLAGCVGSQMYLAAFQRPGGRNTVLAPRNFFLKDDVLISHCMGHSLEVAFGTELDFSRPKNQRLWHFDARHLPTL